MKLNQTIQWYNKHADHYGKQADLYPPLAQMNDFVRLLPEKGNILDAGCGTGRDSSLLAQKGFKVTGLDLSPELLKIAKTKSPTSNFIEGSFLQLPFPDNSFQGLWAHASLVHLETFRDTEKAIQEFHRVLSPKGILHILVKAQLGKEKFVTVEDKRTQDLRFFQLYTQEELKTLTEETGFRTLKIYQFADKNSNEKYKIPVEWIAYLGEAQKA